MSSAIPIGRNPTDGHTTYCVLQQIPTEHKGTFFLAWAVKHKIAYVIIFLFNQKITYAMF